ncbi:winged helix-turn-helix transcriptional regulator [Rhizobium alvei]|uniref:Helix-turn-helix domain-containing protein n=1 Tax=Rhizobium alvei TaxID=1132659 RepID=A0ABT8YLR5_9HYPH|nr:helix-turn-helix domain-containing protein [Rhizobium alvei]MDO6964663.1 helix-turn-helix domain-containing protein [Rhizobium alvei]
MNFDLEGKRRNIEKTLAQREDREEVYRALGDLAERMSRSRHDRDAPVREIMARLGDRWSPLILVILETGTYRYAELRRLVCILASEQNISQRMLTLRLRALERDGLVVRTVTPTVPPRTDYALTPLGQELQKLMNMLIGWISSHEADIEAARSRFERQDD